MSALRKNGVRQNDDYAGDINFYQYMFHASHGLSSFPQQTNGGQSESYPEGLVEGYLEKPRVRGK